MTHRHDKEWLKITARDRDGSMSVFQNRYDTDIFTVSLNIGDIFYFWSIWYVPNFHFRLLLEDRLTKGYDQHILN